MTGMRRGMFGKQTRSVQGLAGRPQAKRPLDRPRHRWEDNIKLDLEEVGWGGMDWIDLA
jgi:hypothetical protein